MRSEFEKYIREQSGFESAFEVGCNGQYKSDLMHFMFITWQHQQTKVDELQEKIDKALKRADHACIGTAMFHKQFNDVISILRGEE